MRLQIARIFGAIARGLAEVSAAFGFYGLRAGCVAPIILAASAGLAFLSSLSWMVEAAMGGSDIEHGVYASLFHSEFWRVAAETYTDVVNGDASVAVDAEFKASALGVVAGTLFLGLVIATLAATPAGWLVLGISVAIEVMGVASAGYWFVGSGAAYDEKIKSIMKAQREGSITPADAAQQMKYADNIRFFQRTAATLFVATLVASAIPVIGPILGAVVGLVAAISWGVSFFYQKKSDAFSESLKLSDEHKNHQHPQVKHRESPKPEHEQAPAPGSKLESRQEHSAEQDSNSEQKNDSASLRR